MITFGQICPSHPGLNGRRGTCGNHTRCTGCIADTKKTNYQNNKIKRKAEQKGYRQKNKEKISIQQKIWRDNNPGKIATKNIARKTSIEQAIPPWADRKAIQNIYMEAKKLDVVVDHWYPLKGKMVCGLHVEQNLCLLTQEQNDSKGNKMPEEWEALQ